MRARVPKPRSAGNVSAKALRGSRTNRARAHLLHCAADVCALRGSACADAAVGGQALVRYEPWLACRVACTLARTDLDSHRLLPVLL